jgi:hypothetical protein
MKLKEIQTIQLSLLKKETEVYWDNTAEFTKLKTATFKIPPNFSKTKQMLRLLVSKIYEDILVDVSPEADYLGLWLISDDAIIENSISLSTLNSIQEYSLEHNNPIVDFFNMTVIKENGQRGPLS